MRCIMCKGNTVQQSFLRMGKVQKDETEDLMDSVGVMMVRQKVKSLHYRNYEGFNMMTVVI